MPTILWLTFFKQNTSLNHNFSNYIISYQEKVTNCVTTLLIWSVCSIFRELFVVSHFVSITRFGFYFYHFTETPRLPSTLQAQYCCLFSLTNFIEFVVSAQFFTVLQKN